MWYKTAVQGRIIKRVEDLEKKLFDLVEKSTVNFKGKKMLNFTTLNNFLTPDIYPYVNQIFPIKDPDFIAGFIPNKKVLYLPVEYNKDIYKALIHEFVHAIHNVDLKNLPFQKFSFFDYTKPIHLAGTFEKFLVGDYPRFVSYMMDRFPYIKDDYYKYQNESKETDYFELLRNFPISKYGQKYKRIFDTYREPTPEQWELARRISKRISPVEDLYYATNEELLAYFETAVQYFSKDNLLEVYRKYYEDPNQFLSYLKNAIKSIGFDKDEKKVIRFKGPSEELKDLVDKIHLVTGENKLGVIERIVVPKWWQQLVKNLNNVYFQLEKELIYGEFED